MFTATLTIPAEQRQMAHVLKDTFLDALEGGPYKHVRVGFPKTPSQRSRGKVIGICCSYAEALMESKVGKGQAVITVVHSPNRVQVTLGINVLTAVKLTRDLDQAKVTLEMADYMGRAQEDLQKQLDEWLE